MGKYGPEKTQYVDIFRAVYFVPFSSGSVVDFEQVNVFGDVST